nr:PREDICTED: protein AMBP [Lepisosteus oculatus]
MRIPLCALLAAFLPLALGVPLPDAPPAVEIQENFDLDKFMGKWYDIALGSTCPWVQKHKDKMSMGTLNLQPSEDSTEIDMTMTFTRHGTCKQIVGVYKKTETPGHMTYHNNKWATDVDSYIVRTNYAEYALTLMIKSRPGYNSTRTVRLYGRTQELRPSLIDDFTQYAKTHGIDDDSIIILPKKDECVPGETEGTPQITRARRDTVLDAGDEGSGTGELAQFWDSESCKLAPDAGPCLGYMTRFHYNSSLMACQSFGYGGCLGNGNNFVTEKECLQSCRTEAACRLPMDPGPCFASVQLWAFDSDSGKCVPFKYGGCQGNGNKFYTQKECEEYCGATKDGEEEFLGLPKKN